MAELEGRVALVTGAARGLGAAHAQALATAGAAVVVNDVGSSPDGSTTGESVGQDIVMSIRAAGGHAALDASDISSFEGATTAVSTTMSHFGRIDIVVNNAGIIDTAGAMTVDEEQMLRLFRVHVLGSLGTVRAALPHMRSQGHGRVINTISEAALDSRMASGPAYASAKAAIWGLTMSLANEVASDGVTVNAVSPGAATRLSAGFLADQQPTGLDLAPDHVARVVLALAGDEAGDINGRVVHAAAGHIREYLLRRTADTDLVRRLRDLP